MELTQKEAEMIDAIRSLKEKEKSEDEFKKLKEKLWSKIEDFANGKEVSFLETNE